MESVLETPSVGDSYSRSSPSFCLRPGGCPPDEAAPGPRREESSQLVQKAKVTRSCRACSMVVGCHPPPTPRERGRKGQHELSPGSCLFLHQPGSATNTPWLMAPNVKACMESLKGLVRLLVVQWLRLYTPNAGGRGSIPGQGTESHMLQLKILHATTKTWSSQINKY